MKNARSISRAILILGVVVLAWVLIHGRREQAMAGGGEAYFRQLQGYRSGAAAALAPAITNAVAGLRAVRSSYMDIDDDDFRKWAAGAEVEFTNRAGGVDRTNLEFSFIPSGSQAAWRPKGPE